jgi:4-hydroxybutyryl-CoA dehydratase/vinylacetyl-CoA-Delta-isomerase
MDYAVSFGIPSDGESIIHILGRQSCDTRRLEDSVMDVGNAMLGGHEALVIFNDVFVPTERLFMDGEWQFSGMLVARFAGYRRQSYGGCKVGVGDMLIGAAATAAEYAGVDRASHVKRKLGEMIHLNETLFSCGLGCSVAGTAVSSGTYLVDLLLANVCKQNVTRLPHEIARLAEDLAGGLMVTINLSVLCISAVHPA